MDAEEARDLIAAMRVRVWEFAGCATFVEYLERYTGLNAHAAYDRVRVADALQRLPLLEAKLEAGELTYRLGQDFPCGKCQRGIPHVGNDVLAGGNWRCLKRAAGVAVDAVLGDRFGFMSLTVYHYPACSTCKKAIAWLKVEKIDHTLVDIVKNPPSATQLTSAQKASGLPMRKMFNTSGLSYREGKFGDKLPTMTDAHAIAALAKDGKLIKRPLAVGDGVALVGFDESAWKAAFA